VLTDLLVGKLRGSHNGAYFNYTGKELEPAFPAKDQRIATDLFTTSDLLLTQFA
jgi:hypothetical protein